MSKLILFLSFCFAHNFVLAQNLSKSINKLMQQYHNAEMFNGTVLVAHKGKVIYQSAFGKANHEWKIDNTVDTKFMIGSVSKSLTAYLTLLLVQEGKIALHKKLSFYLPNFSKNADSVTISQLLNHTSGFPNYEIISDFFPRISRTYYERQDYINVYKDAPLIYTPGTKHVYSSLGYFTLGYLLEQVSGKSYSALMKEKIFDKLGMNSSGSYAHKQIVTKRAQGYDYAFGGYTSGDFRDQSNTMGTGDLYSTVGDLYKFHTAIQNNTLLNDTLTKLMLTPGMRPFRYGYGWYCQNFRYNPTDSVQANYHLGSTEGFMSFNMRLPQSNSAIIFLSNTAPIDFFGMTKNVLRILHNKPIEFKTPTHKAIGNIAGRSSLKEALIDFDKMVADTANYNTDFIGIHFLEEQLIKNKRWDEALLLCEKAAQHLDKYDLICNNLATVYHHFGRKAEAIIWYKKALAISPNMIEAVTALKQLEK